MDSSGRISNKKKPKKRGSPRKTRRVFSPPVPAPEPVGPDGAGDLIALIQKGRSRGVPALSLPAGERFWERLEEMRDCSRKGLIEFTRDENYFLFQIANKDNCDMEIISKRIAELYEFRKVFAIYWKSVNSNRKSLEWMEQLDRLLGVKRRAP